MKREEQLQLLESVDRESIPDYALKLMHGIPQTEEEAERCRRYCEGVARALGREVVPDTDRVGTPVSSVQDILSGVEEKSLPPFALKALHGEPLTEEEVGEVTRFCQGLGHNV